MISSGLPPGSTTMAFLVMGSPMMVQLHCNGPTGKVSRIRVAGTVINSNSKTVLNISIACSFAWVSIHSRKRSAQGTGGRQHADSMREDYLAQCGTTAAPAQSNRQRIYLSALRLSRLIFYEVLPMNIPRLSLIAVLSLAAC